MGMRMKRLREHREASGLSRDALAKKAGVSAAVIEAHEIGRNQDTLVSVAVPLALALGIKLDELFSPADMVLRVNPSESVAQSA